MACVIAASAAWRLAEDGVLLSFVSQEYEGAADIYAFLEHMAGLQPSPGPSVIETLAGSTDYSLVLTAQKRGTVPAGIWASGYFLFID